MTHKKTDPLGQKNIAAGLSELSQEPINSPVIPSVTIKDKETGKDKELKVEVVDHKYLEENNNLKEKLINSENSIKLLMKQLDEKTARIVELELLNVKLEEHRLELTELVEVVENRIRARGLDVTNLRIKHTELRDKYNLKHNNNNNNNNNKK